MTQAGFPVIQIRFPALHGPIPVVPLGLSSSPGPAPGYTKSMCLCDKLRKNDAERAAKKQQRGY